MSAAGPFQRHTEPHFHLDLDRTEPLSSSSSSSLRPQTAHGSRSQSATPEKRASPLPGFCDPHCGSLEDDVGGIRKRPRGDRVTEDLSGSPRPGLQKYLSRFDDAMKLRGQLANEKQAQDGGSDSEEFDPFRIFRLVGSVLLAVFVRLFVCKYLVSARRGALVTGRRHYRSLFLNLTDDSSIHRHIDHSCGLVTHMTHFGNTCKHLIVQFKSNF